MPLQSDPDDHRYALTPVREARIASRTYAGILKRRQSAYGTSCVVTGLAAGTDHGPGWRC